MTGTDASDAGLGLATLAFVAGLVVAVHAAPGPAFDHGLWSGKVKVAHGYLAYLGVNGGVSLGAFPRTR